ncbi:MAG: ATP-binding cassette domain-containing protein [Gudongella sp.]|nr:ATP-binding cassette domain-containing protein [Gudongella sp.]
MIEAKNLSLIYKDGTHGIKDVNLLIPQGELVYVTGTSGSGKTSFIKLLLGIEKPSSGSLDVIGYSMNNISSTKLQSLRQLIGPVFQDFKLLNGRSVYDNVLVGLRFLDYSDEKMHELSLNAMEKVGLSHKVHSPVENLSYGERQRVAIARAVARSPRLIIADEPTGNLDKKNALIVLDLLKSFQSNETSVIITTHAVALIEDEKNAMHILVEDTKMSVRDRYGK